jgi:hypothetical protein
MDKSIPTWVFLLFVAFIIGMMMGTIGGRFTGKKFQRESEQLRKSLEKEKKNVIELRRGMARERELFQGQILKSEARIDSVRRVHLQREAKLRAELNGLKKMTVKELQDEGERIYREHADKHQ